MTNFDLGKETISPQDSKKWKDGKAVATARD